MHNSQITPQPRRQRGFGRGLLLMVLALIILSAGGFGAYTSLVLEEQDTFCISCHNVPEQTYFDRAQQSQAGDTPGDLASVHMGRPEPTFKCITCHRGTGNLGDRIGSVTLGARDTLIHFAGRADPAIEKRTAAYPALIERSCILCHLDTLLVARYENHFHVKLPATWSAIQNGAQPISPQGPTDQRSDPEALNTSVTCRACHVAHRSGLEALNYLDESGVVIPACDTCHVESGKGPIGLAP